MVSPGGFTNLFLALGLMHAGAFGPTPVVGRLHAVRYARDIPPTPISSQVGNNNFSGASPGRPFGNSDVKNLNPKDDSCTVERDTSPPLAPQTFSPFDQAKATVYRYRQQQSVNLGSWYVHRLVLVQLAIYPLPSGLFTNSG